MSAVDRLITKFGSQTRLAEALGTGQSNVAYWAKRGRIPAKWHPEILEAATRLGLSISAADLIDPPGPSEAERAALPNARWRGPLTLMENALPIDCYVLDTGRRLISRSSTVAAIAGPSENDKRRGGDLEAYLKPLNRYLSINIADELVEFTIAGVTNKRAFGITAEAFLEICRAFVAARDVNEFAMTDRQIEMAKRCNSFLAACATIGLIALIDEATGYQYDRAADALQVKLQAFLEEEMRPWEKTFPDELWLEFGRLTGWSGSVQQRPKYWGKLILELVYEYLDADVAQWLKQNAPKPRHGQNYHQWLSSQYGLKKLMEHIWMLIGVASTCSNMTELRYQMAKRYGKEPLQMLLFVPSRIPAV